jgi:hypothetical protein
MKPAPTIHLGEVSIPCWTKPGGAVKPKKEKEKVLDTDKAARYITSRGLKMRPQTLRMYRHREKGPVYQKPNGRVTYKVADLDAYVEHGQVMKKNSRLRSER